MLQAAFGDSVDLVVDYLVVPTENWDIEVLKFNIRMSFASSPVLYHQVQFSLGQQEMALELEQEQKTQVEQQERNLKYLRGMTPNSSRLTSARCMSMIKVPR